jgi:DNA-binding CsgD family transcriptional regulator
MMRDRELQCRYCLSPGRRGAPSRSRRAAPGRLRDWVYDPETVISRTISPTVRGRDAELTALGALFGRVRSGSGSVLMIEGAAGMGKSRLIGEGLRMAARLSFPVGTGTAEPSESMAELAPLLRALFDGPRPLLDHAGLSSLPAAPEQRYWRIENLQSLLEHAAMGSPLLVFLDDLQWADSGTIAALRALPPRLASVPIGWILAMRPDSCPAHLHRAIESLTDEGAERLLLKPLSPPAVAQVAKDVIQAEPDETLLRLAGQAGGNPFLLVELLEGLRQEALVRVDNGLATLTDNRLPDRVGTSMRQRLALMSISARQVATVGGSLGRTFSFADLAMMIDVPPASVLSSVEELMEVGIVSERGDRLSFQHDLIREAVRLACPPSARRALDRQAADVMLARGALPVEVAIQLGASAEPGDEVAIATLLSAAESLATTDPGASADLSRRALELAPDTHPLRGRLVVQAAMSLHAAGRIEEAKAFADGRMRVVLPVAEEGEVRLGIASMWLLSPDVRVHASLEALKLEGLSEDLRLAHIAKLAYNLTMGGWTEQAHVRFSEAVAAGGRLNRDAQFPLAISEGCLQYVGGDFSRALELLEVALREGLAKAHGLDELAIRLVRSMTLLALDRTEDALDAINAMVGESLKRGFSGFLHVAELTRGQMLLQLGRLEDAGALMDGRFDLQGPAVSTSMDASGVAALGRLALHTGNGRQLRQMTEIARTMMNETTPGVRRHAAWLLSLEATADGDPGEAHRWLCAMGEPERKDVLSRLWPDLTETPQLVRMALAVGDGELVDHAVACANDRSKRNPDVRSLAATATHASGLANGDADALSEAVRLFAPGSRPLALAAAYEDLGLAEQRDRISDSGAESFTQSLVLFARAGATSDAARLRGRLRGLGIRRRVISAEKPTGGWAALTQSENAVAQLVADGFTNREVAEHLFISPHTVNTHLRQVFAKLQINSRVDLTRLAAERKSESGRSIRQIAEGSVRAL